jgi:hypothetical protein
MFKMTKVVLAPYDDLVAGYPRSNARGAPPKILKYPDGQTVSNPKASRARCLAAFRPSNDTSKAIARKTALNRRFSCSLPTSPLVPKGATIAFRIMFLIP